MSKDVDLAALYRTPINLWVEDDLTREYLSAVWNDPTVSFRIGGGNQGVRAVAKDAETSGFWNVFAVIDRDFLPSNYGDWLVTCTFRNFLPQAVKPW